MGDRVEKYKKFVNYVIQIACICSASLNYVALFGAFGAASRSGCLGYNLHIFDLDLCTYRNYVYVCFLFNDRVSKTLCMYIYIKRLVGQFATCM